MLRSSGQIYQIQTSMVFERTGYWLTFLFEILLILQCLSRLIIKVDQRELPLTLLQTAFKLIGIKTFFVTVTTFETNENHSMRVVTKDNSSENFNKHPTKKAMAEFFFHKISGLDIYKTRMGSKTLFNFVKKRIGH